MGIFTTGALSIGVNVGLFGITSSPKATTASFIPSDMNSLYIIYSPSHLSL